MTYTVDDIKLLAKHGVSLTISADDILQLAESVSRAKPAMPEYVSIEKAMQLYQCSRPTMRRYIENGIIAAVKIGGKWRVETPQLNNNLKL